MAIASLNDTGPARREILRHPTTAQLDGRLAVNDCLFISPPATSASASFYQGTLDVAGREARVTGLKAISPSGCIPSQINDQVLKDYAEYWIGTAEISENLADLDRDRLAELTTGSHRENLTATYEGLLPRADESGTVRRCIRKSWSGGIQRQSSFSIVKSRTPSTGCTRTVSACPIPRRRHPIRLICAR